MQRLLAFLENNLHLLLFVALQLVCMYLLFSLNPFQQAYLSNRTAAVTANINGKSDAISDYFNLDIENKKLQESFATEFSKAPLSKLSFLGEAVKLSDTSTKQMFTALPAQVVFNTVHKAENVFVIDRGSEDGIENTMGVVSASGVAGVVLSTSKNFSVVMSVLNTNFKFTPQINDQEYYSNVSWQNSEPNTMSIDGINKLEEIVVGDLVSTGRSSLLFPPGIPIGYISKLEEKSNSQYFQTTFKTATNFRQLEYVFVIKNKFKTELDQLLPQND